MIKTGRIAAAAQMNPPHLPGGAVVHPIEYMVHWAHHASLALSQTTYRPIHPFLTNT